MIVSNLSCTVPECIVGNFNVFAQYSDSQAEIYCFSESGSCDRKRKHLHLLLLLENNNNFIS